MHLENIRARRIYGRLDFDIEVDPVTIVTGANESGKTSLIGLVGLVLEGPSGPAWPLLGERPAYDWQASLSFRMDPTEKGESGLLDVERGMFRGEHFVRVGHEPVGVRDATKAIKAYGFETAVTWSAASFMLGSAKTRMEWLLARVIDGEGWTVSKVSGEAAAILGSSEDLWPESDWKAEPTGRQALDRLLTDLRAMDHATDTEARRLSKVVEQDLAEGPMAALPPGTVASWMTTREGLDQELARALQARGDAEGTDRTIKVLKEEQVRLYAQIEVLQNDEVLAAREKAALEALQAGADGRRQLEPERGRRLQTQEAARAALVRAEERTKTAHARLQAAKEDQARAEAALAVRGVYEPALVVLRAVEADEGCSHADAAREALRVIDMATSVAPGKDGVHPLNDFMQDHAGERLAEEAARRVLQRAAEALKAIDGRFGAAADSLSAIETEARLAKEARETRTSRLTELTERHERLTSQIEAAGTPNIDAIDAQIEALRLKRKDAQTAIDRLTDATGAQAARVEHHTALLKAKDRRGRLRAALKDLEALRAEMTLALFAPLRERVSAVTEKVLDARWDMEANGGWDWELWRGEAKHAHGSNSGGVVALAALHVAIAEKLGGWRHVVLDDMENLETGRRERLVKALWDEVEAGRLDNALVACVGDWNYAPSDRCSVVEMGA